MSGIEDEKVPPGAVDFKFPEIPGFAEPGPEVVQSKYYVGQAYNPSWWGRPNEFNEQLKIAKSKTDEDGNPKELWLDDKNCLTEAGVEELERSGTEKKTSSPIDRLAASKAGYKNRIAERPVFSTSHAARKPTELTTTSSVDRLEAVQRKIATMSEKEKNRPETEEEVLELFGDAVKSQGFNVIESTVESTGISPLGKALYSFDMTISRAGRKGKNEPMHKFYEGSKESILMAIGKLR